MAGGKRKRAPRENEGRPSKYKQEYCDGIIDYMKDGKSLVQYAALIGVAKSTIYEWGHTNGEFSNALDQAITACEAYWERILVARTVKKMAGSDVLLMFYMKNRFRWSEKSEVKTEQAVTFSTQIGDSGEVIREKS